MAAAPVTVNWQAVDRTSPAMRREVVQCTTATTLDWYDAIGITTIVGVNISCNSVGLIAADAFSATFAGNRVTLNLVATAAGLDYTIEIYGFN